MNTFLLINFKSLHIGYGHHLGIFGVGEEESGEVARVPFNTSAWR